MKLLSSLLLITVLCACVHKRIVVNRLEGKWTLEKQLNPNGSYTGFSDVTIVFSGGKADGKTYLPCETDSSGLVTQGTYLVSKRGTELYLRYDSNDPTRKDDFIIEDMDKESLIVRNQGIVRFFRKEGE